MSLEEGKAYNEPLVGRNPVRKQGENSILLLLGKINVYV